MSRQDVLVLPSLHEGFGLVILEAMSQGLTVITTAHTGGPDVIQDGREGFIVPIRSVDAIVEKLELLAGDRAMLTGMKEAAQKKAALLTWEGYRSRLVEVVRGCLKV
jgi:glycosyltransferase involved in cell wall biosynthesis